MLFLIINVNEKYITQHARSAVAPFPIRRPHGSLLQQVMIVLLLCCTAVSPLLRRCYLLLNSRSASAVPSFRIMASS